MSADRPPKLSVLVRRLLSALREIGKALHDQTDAITAAATETKKTANEKKSVPPLVRAEVNFSSGVEIRKSEADTTDDRNYQSRTLSVSWLTFVIAVLTLLSLIGYAFISAGQLHEMRKATKAAQDSVKAIETQMRQDQRPWLNIESDAPLGPDGRLHEIAIGDNKPLFMPLRITVSGKTPARHVKGRMFIEVVPNGQSPKLDSAVVTSAEYDAGMLFPGSANRTFAVRRRLNPTSQEPEGDPLTPEEHKTLLKQEAYVAVYGAVTYDDIFHPSTDHWTKFCFWFSLGGGVYSAQDCAEYNNADNNEPSWNKQ